MNLQLITDYRNQRVTFLKLFEGDKPWVYVDSQQIPTFGIGLNLRTHGELVLQALGFDLGGNRLTGDALQAERDYAERLVEAFSRSYPSDESENNAAQQNFESILRERASDPLLNPASFDPNKFVDEQAYLNFRASMTDRFQIDSGLVRENLFNMAADGYTVPDVDGNPKISLGYEADVDLWLERTGLNVIRPELNFLDSRERAALFSLAYNSKLPEMIRLLPGTKKIYQQHSGQA